MSKSEALHAILVMMGIAALATPPYLLIGNWLINRIYPTQNFADEKEDLNVRDLSHP